MKTQYLAVKVEPELKAKISEMAKAERRSLADQTAYLMVLGIRAIERQGGLSDPMYALPGPGPVMEAQA